ncbi:MAG: hypothetical protein V3571_04780 [Pseudodesulfovibrio sp.]
MINAIDSAVSTAAQTYRQTGASGTVSNAPARTGDTVSISLDARSLRADMANNEEMRRSNEAAEAADPKSSWRMSSGLQEGTFTLDGGNKQTVAIDGNKLEILEYDTNGRLVKSVRGTLSDSGASLDTEFYDKDGKVVQAIHADIMEMKGKDGWTTARMSRSVQNYEDGRLTGEMTDSMLLNSWNSVGTEGENSAKSQLALLLDNGTEKVFEGVDEFTIDTTLEKHIANYYAEVREYGANNRLSRDMTVEYEARHDQLSNRSHEDNGGLDARSTEELEHDTGMTMTVRDYDAEGELVRDATFSDHQKDKATKAADGRQEQNLSISWYNQGELVRRGYGSMGVSETASAKLSGRPSILDTLGLDTEQYLGDEPQSAVELLEANVLTSSSEPDHFMDGIMKAAAGGDYSTAEGIARYGSSDRPYDIDWTDELYNGDGDLVMRQRDKEAARESSFYQRERIIHFGKTRGLTENEVPVVLRQSSHEREDYENGKLVNRQATKARESIEVSYDAPDRVVTNASLVQGPEGKETTTAIKIVGGLDKVDPDPNGAARGFSGELKLTLDGFIEDVREMNRDDVTPQEARHVRLHHESKLTD